MVNIKEWGNRVRTKGHGLVDGGPWAELFSNELGRRQREEKTACEKGRERESARARASERASERERDSEEGMPSIGGLVMAQHTHTWTGHGIYQTESLHSNFCPESVRGIRSRRFYLGMNPRIENGTKKGSRRQRASAQQRRS